MRSTPAPLTVGVRDAAAMTGLSKSKLYELLDDGTLRHVNIGRRRLIPVAAIRELVGETEAA